MSTDSSAPGTEYQTVSTGGIEIVADDPRAAIELGVLDDELPLVTDLPTWLVVAASGPALKLAHLIVLLHRQPPPDRPITRDLFAALLGKSVDRVDAYAKELETIGWLTVVRRRVSRWQVPNEYRYRQSPPPGHVTPRTLGDLLAVVDARHSAPVDNSKTAGQQAAAKTRLRSRKNAAPAETGEQNRRSASSRKNAATEPQKRGSYKELRTVLSKDRSIERASASASEVAPRGTTTTTAPSPSEPARELVRTLAYGRHGMPSAADVDRLAVLIDTATDRGLSLAELRTHCQAAIGRASTAVVPYLVGALEVDRLPVPRPRRTVVSDVLPPVCGQCDARPGDHAGARMVTGDDERARRCPHCHPSMLTNT